MERPDAAEIVVRVILSPDLRALATAVIVPVPAVTLPLGPVVAGVSVEATEVTMVPTLPWVIS